MDPDVLLTQLYRVDTGDNATMRTGTVKAVYPIRGTIDVEVAGELLREIPYGAGLNPVIDSTVWLIEQGNWFAAISAAASSGQYAGVDEVLVGGEPPTASAVDLWMDTNSVGEGDGWAVLDERYAANTHSHRASAQFAWTYDAPETMADPGAEKLRTNTASGTAATQIAIDIIAKGGQDATNTLNELQVGDPIYFQQFDDAANSGEYRVTGTPTNNGSWFLIPVTRASVTGTAISKNQDVLIEFTYGEGTGAGVNPAGDTMTGSLNFDGPLLTGVSMKEPGGQIRGIGMRDNSPDGGSIGLAVYNEAGALSPLSVQHSPSYATQATNKRYVDGGGAMNSVSYSVPTNISGTYHMSTIAGNTLTWGSAVGLSGSGIIVTNAGWYRIALNGGFASNGNGTIRMLAVLCYPALNIGTNTNNVGQYSAPSANTTGFGAVLSATGFWYLPAGQIVVVVARQDSGAALNATATFTVERIVGVS